MCAIVPKIDQIIDMSLLSAIIVSYNTREMTLDCLKTLYGELKDIDAEVWVVDNASRDGSAEAIVSAYPDARVIASETNLGFGAANNRAMSEACGAYFLLLNSDAFPCPGAVRALIDYMNAHPDVGVAGPRLLNRDGSVQLSCFRFPSPMRCWLENLWISAAFRGNALICDYRQWAHDRERIVDFVSGACLLARRDVFERVGGFDEKFFMYAEETDWQRRITDAGWTIAFTPNAEVVHYAGASGGADAARVSQHVFNSLDYYEWKHHGLFGLIALRSAMIAGSFMRLALWSAVLLLMPGRRAAAAPRAKLHAWLLWRQSTCWRLAFRPR